MRMMYGNKDVWSRQKLRKLKCLDFLQSKYMRKLFKHKLGIIANQTDGLTTRLSSWGILKYFSFIISSWDYQIMKPDTKLFQIAVKQSGYNASETIMVGDRLDNDIFPAKTIGMKTIWIKQGFGAMQKPKTIEYIPDKEIANLSELLYIL
ncbi:HAD family hydrolase [Clostridium sp. JN-9]|nr:HAD family hydrolase [Clostridium sp. JN-9]